MRITLLVLILALSFFLSPAQTITDSSHHVPLDKHLSKDWERMLYDSSRKSYSGDELLTIGMPCGGLAAGQLYVRGDGSLANWWIANDAYNTGYGIDSLIRFKTAMGPWKVCYQTFRPASYVDQGFMISTTTAGRTLSARLDQSGFDDIHFTGEYPVASISYASRSRALPVQVSERVFSPFIPMNARESATPGTVLQYTVTNITQRPVTVKLAGWLQNFVCDEIRKDFSGDHFNAVAKTAGRYSVEMSLVPGKNPDPVRPFPGVHPYFGNMSLSMLSSDGYADADYTGPGDENRQDSFRAAASDTLRGSVGTSFILGPGQSRQVTFLLTWYFPNRPSYYAGSDVTDILPNDWNEALPTKGVTILGNMYANWYHGSQEVADWLQHNLDRLTATTFLFHDAYYNNNTLPPWLVRRLMMPLSTLSTETCQWWGNGKFWAWEGVGSCVGTCTHVWNYEQGLAHLFPDLERNIRERTDLDLSFQKDGSILSRNGWGGVLIDGDAGTVLKCWREYLNSADPVFLMRNWDRIKRAVVFLMGQDGNADGIIDTTQANTFDISFWGANTYVGSLYLAAVRAGEKMAVLMHDTAFVKKCDSVAAAGSANSVARLWNGKYFIQQVDLKEHPKYQYATGCLSDQLFGQTWAHMYGLGYLYPKDKAQQAIRSVWNFNWAPDVATQNKVHPPERTYADAGEAGLLVCTWPLSTHPGEDGVRYRDEVWTGSEYQAATDMIYENMISEGLSVVKGLDNRYQPAKHNPWNEIECGDHYARALASWGVLLALENYSYDGPAGQLGFAPKINSGHFQSFFTAAEGWGNISQTRTSKSQLNEVWLRYGKLRLSSLRLQPERTPVTVRIKKGNRSWAAPFAMEDGRCVVTFPQTDLNAGDKIEAEILY